MRERLNKLIKEIEDRLMNEGGIESDFLISVNYNKVHTIEVEYNNDKVEWVGVYSDRKSGCHEYYNLEEAIKNAINIDKVNDVIQENRWAIEKEAIDSQYELDRMWDDYYNELRRSWG